MDKPTCTLVKASARYTRKVVRNLRYDLEDLVIDIQGENFAFGRVIFRRPVGFRVLDERDLSHFWNTYSEPSGWLWEVHTGGWMDLESLGPSFSSPSLMPTLCEYLLVDDRCISVLCLQPPEIDDLGAEPDPLRVG